VYSSDSSTAGWAGLGDVSLERCWNKRARAKNPNLPCIQGGWGPALGTHRFGHQSGLEADVTFYHTAQGGPQWFNAKSRPKLFDDERNCIFVEDLLSNEKVEMVMVGPAIIKRMQKWIGDNGYQERFSKIMQGHNVGLIPDSGKGGHDNHFHIRVHFPKDSPSMSDYILASNPKRRRVNINLNKTSRRFRNLKDINLSGPGDTIIKRYGNRFAYTFGTIDGKDGMPEILESHNQSSRFTGASMPKTMAGLAQLIRYKDDASKQLTEKELEGLLLYWARSRSSHKRYPSNKIQRALSKTYKRKNRKYKRRSSDTALGDLSPADVREVSKHFGIKKSTFLWGGGQNKQTTEDMFLFFAGLARMEQGIVEENDPLKQFYKENSKEVSRLIRTQKKRKYSRNMYPSGILNVPGHWGKGGLNNRSVNFVFVIKGRSGKTYVLSVYSQVERYVKINKDESPESKKAKESKIHQNNSHGYDLLNAVLYKLLQKT